jgi:hypothetical protein
MDRDSSSDCRRSYKSARALAVNFIGLGRVQVQQARRGSGFQIASGILFLRSD